jgi:hypothetical protein|tara:strand:- start:1444 stop:1695 length:252 start_codon:yes stop_codon:yes gene_type:complete
MKENIVIRLHFTLGNQAAALNDLASAVAMVCGYVKHVSFNEAGRFYVISIVGASLSELKDTVKHEHIDIDFSVLSLEDDIEAR